MQLEINIYFFCNFPSPCTVSRRSLGFALSLFPVNTQKNNHKLSDERWALTQGQNPLPIYMILNIKDDYSLSEFKGDGKTKLYLDSVVSATNYSIPCNTLHCQIVAFINSSLSSSSIFRLYVQSLGKTQLLWDRRNVGTVLRTAKVLPNQSLSSMYGIIYTDFFWYKLYVLS